MQETVLTLNWTVARDSRNKNVIQIMPHSTSMVAKCVFNILHINCLS